MQRRCATPCADRMRDESMPDEVPAPERAAPEPAERHGKLVIWRRWRPAFATAVTMGIAAGVATLCPNPNKTASVSRRNGGFTSGQASLDLAAASGRRGGLAEDTPVVLMGIGSPTTAPRVGFLSQI